MNKKATFFILILAMMTIFLAGCGPKVVATPTTDPNLIYTAAAQTADARLTQIFQSTPSVTPVTPSPTFDATQTAAVQTASSVLTQVAAVSPTPQGTTVPTAAPTVNPADERALFVADVTIPDGTVIGSGAAFVKTWKLQNAGTTTWSTSYALVFVSGDQMGTVTSVALTQSVAPGQQVDVSVNMVAPTADGTYQGYWKLKNASGQFFNDSVYVQIKVGGGGSGTAVPTSTGSAGNPVSNLSMSVDEGTYLGQCPHTFSFAATFTVNQNTTLTYKLEAYSETPGFGFNLPGEQTSTFPPTTYSLSFPLEFTDSGTGWVRLHITAPVDLTSNQVSFNLTCNP
jgi:Ig-like domain from next to BRCA1 gene